MSQKLFVGPKVRRLREGRGWKLEPCAARLGVSVSYLSQIEANQRPVTARVLISMMRVFDVDAASLDADDDQRMIADLREATAESAAEAPAPSLAELKLVVTNAPSFARHYLDLHRAHRRAGERLSATDEALALDETVAASAQLPYEEVRDYFHYKNNYIHALDVAAEQLHGRCGLAPEIPLESALEAYLRDKLQVVVRRVAEGDLMRRFDPERRELTLNMAQPAETRTFQMACHVVAAELGEIIEAELEASELRSPAAVDICRISLTNYAAGALVLPYEAFRQAAQELRHDIDALTLRFQSSFEQTCHRLSTLQRPSARGVPFYFVRVDPAGNITKRHSATRFQFARFGGTCPLWNVHEAFGRDGRILTQVAEMPDGARYLCLAWSVLKRSGGHGTPDRRYALGLGCEVEYADAIVYSDGVDLKGPPARIGVSCRICERDDCLQRAFPPVDRSFRVSRTERSIVPFSLS
ncbi:helix-turn-helix domain-containing protein [Phenylobacterium sp. 58.2.17]|uniref:helix-turn-helix domain-containing protein n=1 Tax=Phenylobacterium sp. 58.2.17 TaxID=2969306 RepID=UPI002263C474|nr:short-chain fatty acyl-CoA regulator family protein [Phenylobacterium sp. 58.2.17]MCX7586369.1 short-chain fatty acyl-CoA regulator family protein [Phenylobacterium sp. 58.2.17]